jgi:hypothetical protein
MDRIGLTTRGPAAQAPEIIRIAEGATLFMAGLLNVFERAVRSM